jgi:preprotein translocase subunit SecY
MPQKAARPRLIQAMLDAFSLPDLRRRILIPSVFWWSSAHRPYPVPNVDPTALAMSFSPPPVRHV